ncbi:MAG TPA: CBS domain-containing protein [Acidocella sp.]|uniref:CBS domain-containing protein n=1 Tax=Acidocella sp. TaxID=50710 RepID=UPI002C5E2C2B|nr:CBS domain-containing protein [Acidocella sp.]HVE21188.1 CBS domain-containing protein [Acidocella sp.]
MTSHAEWIAPTLSITEAARKLRDHKIGCLPVGENDRLVGILTDRDIVCRAVAGGADLATTKAADVMTKGVTYCFEDDTIEAAIDQLEANRIHHIPVLSRQKRMVGILSLSDLASRGPQNLLTRVSQLASRDSSRSAAH